TNKCGILIQIQKTDLIFPNIFAVGILVWLNGVYLLIKYGEYSRFFSESYMTLTVLVTVTSAALLLVTGCVGSWVSLKDSICLQGLVRLSLDTEMAPFSGVFENYTGSSEDSNSRSVDAMQEELKCCGVKNYTDWLETTWFNKSGKLRFPYSCCNVTFPTCNGTVHQPWQIYTQGCHEELSKVIQFALKMVMWSSLLVYVEETSGRPGSVKGGHLSSTCCGREQEINNQYDVRK
uniref:Tetraspanin 37 n=1 Tax=Neolamprologus brichardi TaxID=32507 RepID=A0A3Q4N648_NEOBR